MSRPVVFLACQVFQELLHQVLPADLAQQAVFLTYGLHQTPRKLKQALQAQINAVGTPSLVALAFGLCGNGLHGLRAGAHFLLVPRSDDCIALLLGSYATYREQFDTSAATYYLSKGWLESGSNPLDEYRGYVEKYGPTQAARIMDVQYHHYRRLVFVAQDATDFERCHMKARQVADYCAQWGMEYEEILGSDVYIRRLVEIATDPQKSDAEFVLIPPGGELRQEHFLRM